MESQNQFQTNESQCCDDNCKVTYRNDQTEIVNIYKCKQKSFSSGDMWNIRRNRKEAGIRKMI